MAVTKRRKQKRMAQTSSRKKKNKSHRQQPGKKGEAAQYVTRGQALSKLQVPLADFRRLCILKGVYPRDPKKKSKGLDKTYYHTKDISYLSHEPLLKKFFELKTFMKKFKRLMGRDERDLAAGLESRRPTYTLHHLVRERYPAFDDAVRDLDDALSMLALFQALSGDQTRGIPVAAINEATRLYQEFQLYLIRSQALRKVFATVKGYYFQAEISGQSITWLVPHQFVQELPAEVDFRVMLTFLEFYRAMVKFVNFRLYADLGLAYPPKRDTRRDARSAEVAALEVEMKEAGVSRESTAQQGEKEDVEVASGALADFGANTHETAELQRQLAAAHRMKTVFRGLRVFINREVPLRPIYFTLLCGGVLEVGWERAASADGTAEHGSAFSVSDERITHHVADRPADQVEARPGREYVQPQWVLDSFNVGCLLPVAGYALGRAPPPHLSPFVDDKTEGYVPRQREILDRLAEEAACGTSLAPPTAAPAAAPAAAAAAAPPAAAAAAAVGEDGAASREAAGDEAGGAPPLGGGLAGTINGGAGASNGAISSGGTRLPEPSFEQFNDELRAEAAGVWHSQFKKQQPEVVAEEPESSVGGEVTSPGTTAPALPSREGMQPAPRPTEEEEERLRAKALMSKKHKRLLHKIESGVQSRQNATERLLKKRRQLEASAGGGGGD